LPFERALEMVLAGEIRHAASCVLLLRGGTAAGPLTQERLVTPPVRLQLPVPWRRDPPAGFVIERGSRLEVALRQAAIAAGALRLGDRSAPAPRRWNRRSIEELTGLIE